MTSWCNDPSICFARFSPSIKSLADPKRSEFRVTPSLTTHCTGIPRDVANRSKYLYFAADVTIKMCDISLFFSIVWHQCSNMLVFPSPTGNKAFGSPFNAASSGSRESSTSLSRRVSVAAARIIAIIFIVYLTPSREKKFQKAFGWVVGVHSVNTVTKFKIQIIQKEGMLNATFKYIPSTISKF